MLRTISNTLESLHSDKSLGSKRTLCGDLSKASRSYNKKARITHGRSRPLRTVASTVASTVTEQSKELPPTEAELLEAFAEKLPLLEYDADRQAWDERRRDVEFINYKTDLMRNWKKFEKEDPVTSEFMEVVQTDLKPRMLTVLYGWIVEVNVKFKLHEESLWQAMTLCNRFLSKVDVPRNRLQLVGSACLWIAAKYSEIYPPLAKDFVYISDNAYKREDLLEQEKEICNELDYNFSGPTPYIFAMRYIDVAVHGLSAKNRVRVRYLTLYGLERAALTYKLYNRSYSDLAAAALHCALSCTGHRWSPQVEKLTGVSVKYIKPLSREIRNIVLIFNDKKHQAVINKYKAKKLGSVANLRIKAQGQQPSRSRRPN